MFFAAADSLLSLGTLPATMSITRYAGRMQKRPKLDWRKQTTDRGREIDGAPRTERCNRIRAVRRLRLDRLGRASERLWDALNKLGSDPVPRIAEALIEAACDERWTDRVAALSAIARHGVPSFFERIVPLLKDKKAPVRFAAAATVLRLSALVNLERAPQRAAQQCKHPRRPV